MGVRKTFQGVEIDFEFDSNIVILYILKMVAFIIGRKFFWHCNYKYYIDKGLEIRLVDLLENNKLIYLSNEHPNLNLDNSLNQEEIEQIVDDYVSGWRKGFLKGKKNAIKSLKIARFRFPSRLLRISGVLFSSKNQNEVFEPITLDWQEEYFEALSNKEIWKARWINVQYTYAFLLSMWQKSPIGDLFEFILKIALKVAK